MPIKNNKPIIFSTELHWTGDKSGTVSLLLAKKGLMVSTAPEFGGPDGQWSPEHLFLSSITSCFMSTYLVFVDKMKIDHTGFECTATGQAELIDGKYKFTYIHIYPKAYVANESDVEKAAVAMEKSKKYCLITNSINAEVVQHAEVVVSKRHAAINTAA